MNDVCLPNDWTLSPLTQIAQIIRGVSYKKEDSSDTSKVGYMPLLRATNIQNGSLILDNDLVYAPIKVIKPEQYLQEGDIVVCMSSGSKHLVGKTGQVNKVWKGTFGTFCAVIRPDDKINKKFLGYYFSAPTYRNFISKQSAGININNLKPSDFDLLEIPIPTLEEQNQIVSKIEELFSQLDAGVAGLKRVQELLKQYRASVLKAAFEGRLVPQDPNDKPNTQISSNLQRGWKWVRISDVADINKRAGILKELNDDLEVTFVPMASVDAVSGAISTPEIKKLGEVKKGYTSFIEGDVIFAKITPCMENGKAAIARNLINRIGFGSTEFHVLRANPLVLPEWLYYFIRQESFRRNAKANFTGTAGQMRVPKQFLIDHIIPLPPIYEQRKIVNSIESITSFIEEIGRLASVNIIRADRLRQTILKSAFEGKLI